MGETLGRLGKHKEAIDLLETVIRVGIHPDCGFLSEFYIVLGDNLFGVQKFEEAVGAYKHSFDIAPREIERSPHYLQIYSKYRVGTQGKIGHCLAKLER